MAEHLDFPVEESSHEETIIITSQQLPEIAAWKNRQNYTITRTDKGATQIRRTEFEDGTFAVELRLNSEPTFEGELSS